MTLADGGYSRQALWFDAPITFIWLSNLPIWDVSDEGYSRNASCALIFIFTFLLAMLFRLYWYLAHEHFLFIWLGESFDLMKIIQ